MGTFDNDAASNYQRNQKVGNAGTSALKGAGYGAAAGAMIGGPAAPVTAAIGAGIGGTVGLVGGALKSVDQMEKERRAFLEQETAAAKAGELGYSESEKQRQVARIQQAGAANIQAQQTNLARQHQSDGGFSGQYAALQRSLGDKGADIGVRAMGGVEDASQRQEVSRYSNLMSGLSDHANIVAEDKAARAAQMDAAMNTMMSGVGASIDANSDLAAELQERATAELDPAGMAAFDAADTIREQQQILDDAAAAEVP
jgi:hypothetical protein